MFRGRGRGRPIETRKCARLMLIANVGRDRRARGAPMQGHRARYLRRVQEVGSLWNRRRDHVGAIVAVVTRCGGLWGCQVDPSRSPASHAYCSTSLSNPLPPVCLLTRHHLWPRTDRALLSASPLNPAASPTAHVFCGCTGGFLPSHPGPLHGLHAVSVPLCSRSLGTQLW